MTLKQRIRQHRARLSLLEDQQILIRSLWRTISQQEDELRRLKLEHLRDKQGLVAGWLLHCETPEIDMRDELVALEQAFAHGVAKLEEHVL
jgi:hypothetical protein